MTSKSHARPRVNLHIAHSRPRFSTTLGEGVFVPCYLRQGSLIGQVIFRYSRLREENAPLEWMIRVEHS